MKYPKPVAAVVLAAGKGTRMRSDQPKVLHRVCGLPMVEHVGRALFQAGVDRVVMIVGHRAEEVRQQLGEEKYEYALQTEQLGTGHAALMAQEALAGHEGPVFVVAGDVPRLSVGAIEEILATHIAEEADMTLATNVVANPGSYGRIVRDADGRVQQIVEYRDADSEQALIREVNPAVYVFEKDALFQELPKLSTENAQAEYYLTDLVQALYQQRRNVTSVRYEGRDEFDGVNNRWELAAANQRMRLDICYRLCMAGVDVVDPTTTFIDATVQVEEGARIEPMTTLSGTTTVGAEAVVGPNSKVNDSKIGPGCRVLMSHLNGAVMEEGAKCGPYANLRPGAVLRARAKVGNFVEVKNAELGEGVAASHLTYLGDASIGEGSNIGAGTITCNYDGYNKHRTVLGPGAFIGSNSTLVAPVTIGEGAYIAAGSTITGDVAENALGIGRARQSQKEGWAEKWRERKKGSKD
jgi:bifunctional UDP-N-acetylglucosamine pyrophosphorylase/glucosamine-1-phosphate N-acetyltransferase